MHQLVAAYLDYEAPDDDDGPEHAGQPSAEPPDPRRTPWMSGMAAIPATDALRNAMTPMEGLAAIERLFFGEIKEM